MQNISQAKVRGNALKNVQRSSMLQIHAISEADSASVIRRKFGPLDGTDPFFRIDTHLQTSHSQANT